MRRYLALSLLLIALLTSIIWVFSSFIQPILPSGINSGLLLIVAALIGITGILANLKDSTELLSYIFRSHSKDTNNDDIDRRYEIIHKLQTKGLEDDLHELINWYHSGVVLYLEVLDDMLERGQHLQAKNLMPEILSRAHTTVNELRTIHISIYSRILEEDQLSEALRTLVSVWSQRVIPFNGGALPIIVECPQDITLPSSVKEPLLRIITGALTNAIVHSGVLQDPSITIRISVERTNHQVVVRVVDDGLGAERIIDGYGITRMKNLVRQLNYSGTVAHIDIESKTGKGTKVTLRIAVGS